MSLATSSEGNKSGPASSNEGTLEFRDKMSLQTQRRCIGTDVCK
jgi:hypothetical protein